MCFSSCNNYRVPTIRVARADMPRRYCNWSKNWLNLKRKEARYEITVADLRSGMVLEKRSYSDVSSAEVDGKIVGIALVYPRYSTWKGPVIHLEDLIVTKKMRGHGLGNAPLTEVVKFGYRQGVKRISWEVLDWNEPAIAFYEKKGARVMRDWDVVQLDAKGIETYLKAE